ncbi:MAG: transglycosylase family protein [Streptosporangiaceae bacterium]
MPAASGGAPSSFQQCVAFRESSDNPTASSAGLYGILPSTWASLGYSGTAAQASVAQQTQAFQRLYAQDGTAPWAPYDGC